MGKKIVLLIEDSESSIQLYTSLLDRYDVIIDNASNTNDALQFIRQKDYDVYIIDVKLENDTTGIDVIGKGNATPDRCFILSGNLPENVVSELIKLYKIPREHIMIKPPDTHKFIELMDKILCEDTDFIPEEKISFKKENVVYGVLEHNAEKIESTETIEVLQKKLIREYVKLIFKNLTVKQWVIFIFFCVSLPTTIGPYITSIGYNGHKEFIRTMENSCEERFKNFKKGDKISSKTFLEQTIINDSVSFEIHIYPDNFVSILMTSNDDKFEPRKYWIVSPEYIKSQGLDKDISTLDIIKKVIIGE